MKKVTSLLILIAVIILAGGQPSWGQIKDLAQSERIELAEAYYLVSLQYGKVGEPDKAKAFLETAFAIYPGLDPEKIEIRDVPTAALLILKGETKILAPPERIDANIRLIRSKFLRLISSFLAKDTGSFLELFDGSVYLTALDREFSRDEIRTGMDDFFATASLRGLVPSQFYDINSLEITGAPASIPKSWGETYILTIDAKIDFSSAISFWDIRQQFLIHRTEKGWLFFSSGRSLPPSDWKPMRAAGGISAPPLPEAGPGKEIKEAFLSCLSYFLRKDVSNAAGFFADEVLILRLNVNLSRDELASTFAGYFEAYDFSKLRLEDVLEQKSIIVEESPSFSENKGLTAYLLTVKTRLDLSDTIPFWTRFQEYYFTQEQGAWKIFAIF